ncbi:hypothetical protein PIB30_104183 [Stylosanthes scabra]|uniref:Uncharacterized protein n=1 Tax=Stylosanthes scabra TaxID=79078 RepID=A0ABU6VXE3_9FABA|nr:hypothetical protein [Stylosanthes scabra]
MGPRKKFKRRGVMMVKDLQEGMNQVTHLLHGSTILKHLKLSSPNGKREDLSHQVGACTSHLKYSVSNEGGYIECYVAGRYRVIPLDAIANVCGLSMEGHRFMGGIHAHESWGPYALQRGLNAIGYHDPIGDRQRPSVNKLSTEMRILHYLITYTLLPRGRSHGDSST